MTWTYNPSFRQNLLDWRTVCLLTVLILPATASAQSSGDRPEVTNCSASENSAGGEIVWSYTYNFPADGHARVTIGDVEVHRIDDGHLLPANAGDTTTVNAGTYWVVFEAYNADETVKDSHSIQVTVAAPQP